MLNKNNVLKLNKAKKEKNDEYYTLYDDVQKIFEHLNKDVFDKYRIILPFNDVQSGFRLFCIRQKINYEVVFKDYKNHSYTNNDLVISNPPFSKLKEIVDYFISKNIKFILIIPLTSFSYKNIFNYWKNGFVRFINMSIERFLSQDGNRKHVQCHLLTNLNEQEYPSIFWIPKKSNCKYDVLLRNEIIFNSTCKCFEEHINEFKHSKICFPITFLKTRYAFENKTKLEIRYDIIKLSGTRYFNRIGIRNEE